MRLPDGAAAEDLWVEHGQLVAGPLDGAHVLEAGFVCPGLVDAHGHLSMPFQDCLGHRLDEQFALGERSRSPKLIVEHLARQLKAGVTVVRDAGYVRQRDLVDADLPARPEVLRSGWIVVPEGRYFPGSAIGKSTSAEELVERVHESAAAGMPWFKVIADFPGPDMDLFGAPLNYPIETLTEAIEAAHRCGMRVMAHSTGPSVGEIVDAGVDSVEHGCSITPDIAIVMGQRGVGWAPTLATVEGHFQMAEMLGAEADIAVGWRARIQASLRAALDSGVPVLVGSDELPHGALAEEALVMNRFGLTAQEVLTAATTTARRFLGLPSLEVGAPADLVLYDQDPRVDLSSLRRPVAVMAAGRTIPVGTEV